MNDQELLLLLEENPEQGIHEMMNLYGGAVQTICRNFLGGCAAADIEEAIADTFIHFWKNRTKYSPDETHSLKSYLYAIARNAARDKRRKLKREDIFSTEEVSLDLPSDENIETDFERRQKEEALHDCLSRMKEPDRSIFLYRYFYGFQINEIAKRLSLSSKKVENILYRGKVRLRKALMERGILNHGME